MARPGREFEEAVYAFVQKLDSSAEVLFDHKVPDRFIGTLRQCDVWINTKYGGHWPISGLVSCKDHGRKLNIGDVGTFHDEMQSTGASFGVIYSKSGFTKPALKKAKALGISCCRLYRNEPPDIPTSIWFEAFYCYSTIGLNVLEPEPVPDATTWNDLFGIWVKDSGKTLLERIVDEFLQIQNTVVEEGEKTTRFPSDIGKPVEFIWASGEFLRLEVLCFWKKYRGNIEAVLINGSYCLSDDSFSGSQTMPVIDTEGEHPGSGWVEMEVQDIELPPNRMVTIRSGNPLRSLRENIGPRSITYGSILTKQ